MTAAPNLTKFIQMKRATKPILLCSHAVLGYPDFATNEKSVLAFAKSGVDLMELQFPFSDPVADGPILQMANQKSVTMGTTTKNCFIQSKKYIAASPSVGFIAMTYFNIVFKFGIEAFAKASSDAGFKGVIICDLPIEESNEWTTICAKYDLSPIFLVTPDSSPSRIKTISNLCQGFIYCVARKGTTGLSSHFDQEFRDYISRVRSLTNLPIGVGFGIRTKKDIDEGLLGISDIAIVGSETIRIATERGVEAAAQFLKNLRDDICD